MEFYSLDKYINVDTAFYVTNVVQANVLNGTTSTSTFQPTVVPGTNSGSFTIS